MAEVTGIDVNGREVLLNGSPAVPYDFLVLATGASHSYFGHPEWAAAAPAIKDIPDALRIRQRILSAFEKAELADSDAEKARLLTFAIVGGGATGVELAGAIADVARFTLARDFRRIDPRDTRVILIEAGNRLLPAL
jgi:NADH dehydrogenase